LTSVEKHKYDFLNYEYELNGKKYTRKQAIDKILAVLDVEAKTIKELSSQFEISEQPMTNLIKVMRENNLIKNTKLRRSGHYLFKSHNDCLLAQLLYPSAKEVESQFKVKSVQKRRTEDAPNISSGAKGVTYNASYYDSID
jgi:DNA-binding transcriptional regulator GbsR (MarR family)